MDHWYYLLYLTILFTYLDSGMFCLFIKQDSKSDRGFLGTDLKQSLMANSMLCTCHETAWNPCCFNNFILMADHLLPVSGHWTLRWTRAQRRMGLRWPAFDRQWTLGALTPTQTQSSPWRLKEGLPHRPTQAQATACPMGAMAMCLDPRLPVLAVRGVWDSMTRTQGTKRYPRWTVHCLWPPQKPASGTRAREQHPVRLPASHSLNQTFAAALWARAKVQSVGSSLMTPLLVSAGEFVL